MKTNLLFLFLSILVLASCRTAKPVVPADNALPSAPREFRAAWVATVANINWPSKPGLSTEAQQAEALALLNFLKDHHFNAVIFQVRPQADALYESKLEPWSYYLTGQQGKAPEPFYDPLKFWVNAAHERNIELHVWLNPYRAHHPAGGEIGATSLVKKSPHLVKHLAEGYWWFDPAMKETQDHSAAVVRDLVTRYDIDGVHFDDYFYPYPSYNKGADFPDDESWAAYQAAGGKLSRGDWRRQAVNQFISRLYTDIKSIKPWVKFGLSPFGIWKPGYPESIAGFDQYEGLYADAKLWLNKGWVDYFAPQLYWPISRVSQSFPVLLGWWQGENYQKRHLWPGISVGRDTAKATVAETINQIMISRAMVPESKGVIHWSISSPYKNTALQKALKEGPYQSPALIPASPWLGSAPPPAPKVKHMVKGDAIDLSWSAADQGGVASWVLYARYGNRWQHTILPRQITGHQLQAWKQEQEGRQKLEAVMLTSVSRTGIESPKTEIKL